MSDSDSSDSDVPVSGPTDAGLRTLTATHHLFLQALLSRRVTTEETAVKIHKKCCEILRTPYARNDFADYVAALNGHLHKLGFTLKRADDPYSGSSTGGKPVLVFCNVRDDHLAKHATDLSAQEVAYLRELVREIMEAPNSAFTVKFNDAVSLGRDVKPAMTKTAAQTLLTTLCSKGFLHKSRESNFSLGVRALHELEAYLAQEFEEIVNEHQCASCDEFVSVGVSCLHSDCGCKMHLPCFHRHRRINAKCPSCKQSWPVDPTELGSIGESRVSGKERRRSSKGPRSSGAGALGFQPVNDDDDDEEEEQQQQQQQTSQRRQPAAVKGRPTKRKSQGRQYTNDEEDELEATPAPQTRARR